MLSARDFAAEATAATLEDFDEWQNSFQMLLDSSIGCSLTDGELQKLAREFLKPDEIDRWLRMTEDSVEAADLFFKKVDSSPFSIKEWMQALFTLETWLENQKREMKFEKRIEYIGCCEEFSKLSPAHTTLPEVLAQMLRDHGIW